MTEAFRDAWTDSEVGVVLLTGNGPSPKDGVHAFCAGGDQKIRGDATMLFYMTEEGQEGRNAFNEKRDPDFRKFPRRP